MLDKIRNRILKRSIEKFIKGKAVAKLPDLQRISSVIIILEESEKQLIRSIEKQHEAVVWHRILSFCGIEQLDFRHRVTE